MRNNEQKKRPGRKPIPENKKSVKRSTSFPPDMWLWIEKQAGDTGVPSRIIQKAVRLLQEKTERIKKSGQRDLAVSDAAEEIGQKKIKKAVKELQGGGACF